MKITKAVIPAADDKTRKQLSYIADLIKTEVNVKELEIVGADDSSISLVKRIKPNFKTLGKKYGKQMKEIAAAIGAWDQAAISAIERNGSAELALASGAVVVELADVEIATEDMPGWLVANEGKLTIALDVTVTEELRREGVARELVHRIQNIRKSSGFEITDKISITLSKNILTDDAVNEYKEYICNQVLATSLTLADEVNGTELEFDDFKLYALVSKC